MTIWTPTTVGTVKLPHRLAKAPMTRDRSRADGVPSDLNVEYDRQRASMSLIITEGIQPSEDGQGYLLTPGIYTDAHIAGWTDVTRAVLDAGGRIVASSCT